MSTKRYTEAFEVGVIGQAITRASGWPMWRSGWVSASTA